MRQRTRHSYLVLHQSDPDGAVNGIRVIDAWASSGTITDARQTMQGQIERGEYDKYGPGRVYVVERIPRYDVDFRPEPRSSKLPRPFIVWTDKLAEAAHGLSLSDGDDKTVRELARSAWRSAYVGRALAPTQVAFIQDIRSRLPLVNPSPAARNFEMTWRVAFDAARKAESKVPA